MLIANEILTPGGRVGEELALHPVSPMNKKVSEQGEG